MKIFYGLLTTIVLFAFLLPQALAAPPGGHLNIEEVEVTIGAPNTTLEISGTDFDFGIPLEVTLAGVPATITSSTSTTITATVLTASYPAGDYLLTVSTGNGQSQDDEYDLTIGAVAGAVACPCEAGYAAALGVLFTPRISNLGCSQVSPSMVRLDWFDRSEPHGSSTEWTADIAGGRCAVFKRGFGGRFDDHSYSVENLTVEQGAACQAYLAQVLTACQADPQGGAGD